MASALERWLGEALQRMPDAWVERLAGPAEEVRGRRLDARVRLISRFARRQPRFEQMTPAEARRTSNRSVRLGAGAPLRMASRDHRHIPGPGGPIPIRIYRPPGLSGPRPLLLYFHQGGFVIGNLDWCEPFCTRIAARARCVVLSVDYRKAPEHRFPAAQQDALAVWQWALAHAAEVGGDPRRLAVAGESAGGGLAAYLAQAARDAGGAEPCLQLLVYPWLEAWADNAAYRDFADAFPLDPAGLRWFLAQYLNDAAERDDPRMSPGRTSDLKGLAPAVVVSAGFDPLCDEAEAYAARLAAAGGRVAYRCYDSLCHGFSVLAGPVPAAAWALDEIADDLERVFTGGDVGLPEAAPTADVERAGAPAAP